MTRQMSILLAAGLLIGGAFADPAAAMWPFTSSAKTAKDTLTLTGSQQKMAWKDLSAQAPTKNAPSGFHPTTGSSVPAAVQIKPVSSKAASDAPALKPYDFALVGGKLLIVNPTDRKIAEVITG